MDDDDNRSGLCPNCKLNSAFELVGKRERIWPTRHIYGHRIQGTRLIEDSPPYATIWVDLLIFRCLHCDKTTTYREQWALIPSDDPDLQIPMPRMIHSEAVYPHPDPRELHETVPGEIRSLYAEASRCEQAGAMRAAGVMYRAAVEELVKDQGAPENAKLFHQIEHLKTKGLDEDLIRDLHEGRVLGNGSIHDGLIYSAEEVADVADLIEDATVTLYVQPAERKAMRESRENRRTAAKAK